MRLVALNGTNSGLMLNLITNDTQKLLDAAMDMHFVWFGLVEVVTISTLAVVEGGVSSIAGVLVLFLTQPIQVWMARVIGRLRNKAVKCTDKRVQLIGETLNGIRVIKYNGWTAIFLQRISCLRLTEMSKIKWASFVRATTSTLRDAVVPMASLLTFGTYFVIHKGDFMQPTQAFTILSLFSILLTTFSIAPRGVQTAGEAIIAVKRLQKLLDLDYLNELNIHKDVEEVCTEHAEKAIIVSDCSFSWDGIEENDLGYNLPKGDTKMHTEMKRRVNLELQTGKLSAKEIALHNINLIVNKGEFISIHGPVGSGKSSLLYGILGELQCLKGKYYIHRNVAYVPQQPWILNTTVRQNIICSSPFDAECYQNTITACALEHDILQFAGGHETEIGDRGTNLSGGQKARISLARACYSSAPVVLLDDPLAAVDVATAKYLIKNVFNGILKGRTVILVTHNKAALDQCGHTYIMENGHLYDTSTSSVGKGESLSVSVQEEDNTSDKPGKLHSHSAQTQLENAVIGSGKDNKNLKQKFFLDRADQTEKLKLHKVGSDFYKKIGSSSGKLTVKEDRQEGDINFSTWIAYAKASGGLWFFSFVILAFMIAQAVQVMVVYWLRVWTDKGYRLVPKVYLAVYASFVVGATLLSFSKDLLFTHATAVAAKGMHDEMAKRVLRSPQVFFDQNTAGRILNRFSKDQALVDEILPYTAKQLLEAAFTGLGSLLIMAILIPWFLPALPPFIVMFLYFKRQYATVSCELKRLEAISRSPIYAYFAQTLQGIVSVRAYGIQSEARRQFMSLIDSNHRSYILFVHVARWMGMRLDFAGIMCVTMASILVILLRHSISAGLAGVVLVQSLRVSGSIQYAVRLAAETENYLTSVERILAYTKIPTEADPTTESGIIEDNWPSEGEIEFKKYTLTYREDLCPVLNGVSFKVNAREKIGILGRTGVGKSSLAAALFRMVENAGCSGEILIDGINIKRVGLDDLRQRLSIIPQDPILFEGSIRSNLDPFEIHTDGQIYESLSSVHLLKKIRSLDKGIDSSIAQNGENFSVGQRQLICLARALLRRSQIIVMDEATASVDGETDSVIQTTIHTVFSGCTVLTIAHRIDTVIDCDRVLILIPGGHIAEFDSPSNLLNHQGNGGKSIFAEMVGQHGQ